MIAVIYSFFNYFVVYFKTAAIVISSLKYGDNSLIIRCFTKEFGLRSYLLQGVLSSKKKGLKSALFQPFSQLEIIVTDKNTGHLERIKEAKISYQYQTLHTHIYKSAVVMLMAEICSNISVVGYADIDLYDFFEQKMRFFDESEFLANFHLKFMIDLTRFLGFYPSEIGQERSFFSLEEGIFTDTDQSKYSISGEDLAFFKAIMNTQYADLQQVTTNKRMRNSLLIHLLKYYQWHLPNFGQIKSLAVLQTIFI